MNALNFDLPKGQSSIIKVIGVGGGGSNAVNHMYTQGIVGVDFIICNTDAQALDISPIKNKIQLGPHLTQGLGAGSLPEKGREACEESVDEIREVLSRNTKMIFITAGMGGGTGTGAAPVVARIAKELGILTVGIVTTPFSFEGSRKFQQALSGIEELKKYVDTIIVISNDKISKMFGTLKKSEAFNYANNILATAARGISEIITIPGEINVDFADVNYVMGGGGTALMGNAMAEGPDRALVAIRAALASPLLNDNDIFGAKKILLNITAGVGDHQVTIKEITEINEYIQEHAKDTDIIFGSCDDESLGAKLSVTIIATGFEGHKISGYQEVVTKKVYTLDQKATEVAPLNAQVVESSLQKEEVFELKQDEPVEEAVEEKVETVKLAEPTEEVSEVTNYSLFDMLETTTEKENAVSFEYEFEVNETEVNSIEEEVNHLEVGEMVMEEKVEEVMEQEEVVEEVVEEPVMIVKEYVEVEAQANVDQQMQLNADEERKRRLAHLSYKLRNKQDVTDYESEPAWKRKGLDFENQEHTQFSSQSDISKFSVGESLMDQNKSEIRKTGNSYFDAVD